MSKRDDIEPDSDCESPSESERRPESASATSDQGAASESASMRARRWTIAHRYREPAAYDIPELPAWDVRASGSGGIAFAESEASEPFLRADRPVRVRR